MLPYPVASLAVAAPGLPDGVDGWTRTSLDRVFEALRSSVVAIVGIDVYDRVPWGFLPAPEVWDCRRMPGELAFAYAERSRVAAQQWVQQFPRENVLYLVQFDSQDAAAESAIFLGPKSAG